MLCLSRALLLSDFAALQIPLQNGVQSPETLAAVLGKQRVLGGYCQVSFAFVLRANCMPLLRISLVPPALNSLRCPAWCRVLWCSWWRLRCRRRRRALCTRPSSRRSAWASSLSQRTRRIAPKVAARCTSCEILVVSVCPDAVLQGVDRKPRARLIAAFSIDTQRRTAWFVCAICSPPRGSKWRRRRTSASGTDWVWLAPVGPSSRSFDCLRVLLPLNRRVLCSAGCGAS